MGFTDDNARRLQNRPLLATAPTAGQVVAWNGAAWAPTTLATPAAGESLLTFGKAGGVNVAQLLTTESPNASTWNSFPMGHFIPVTKTLTGLWLMTGSSTAAAAGTFKIHLRYTTPGAGAASLHTLGAGTLIGSCDLIAAGALGALYYRNAQTIVPAPVLGNLPGGSLLFAEVTSVGFWNITDVSVVARIS